MIKNQYYIKQIQLYINIKTKYNSRFFCLHLYADFLNTIYNFDYLQHIHIYIYIFVFFFVYISRSNTELHLKEL
jgi:hypothetical protein